MKPWACPSGQGGDFARAGETQKRWPTCGPIPSGGPQSKAQPDRRTDVFDALRLTAMAADGEAAGIQGQGRHACGIFQTLSGAAVANYVSILSAFR